MEDTMYRKIYQSLLDGIQSGKFSENDRLPTETELAAQYKVSRITSKKALDMLAADGRVTRIAGKGTFVNAFKTQIGVKSKPLIGVAMCNYSSVFGSKFISGIQSVCNERNCLVVPSRHYETQEEETAEISWLINNGVSGIVLMPLHGASYNPIILSTLLKGFPMVMADRYLPGLSVPYVGTDNAGSSKELTRYLFDKGHENIAFISSMATTTALKERIDGFVFAYARSNFIYDRHHVLSNLKSTMPGQNNIRTIQEDVNCITQFLKQNPMVTVAIAADYEVAKVLHVALNQMGKRVPEDFSIVCYDGMDDIVGDLLGIPRYTHIRQDEFSMGAKSAELLLSLLSTGSVAEDTIHLDYQLIEGNTVASLLEHV